MIFIRCLHGMGHMPDEYCAPEQVAAGTAVLLETVFRPRRRRLGLARLAWSGGSHADFLMATIAES
jgi:hypothetical protein